ncbi:MAG: ABC transporter substrate-binding protein [Pygmaiobacter sp.]
MKKAVSIALIFTLALSALTGCGGAAASVAPSSSAVVASSAVTASVPAAPRTAFHIAGLKGPTTMGMVGLMQSADADTARHDYEVTMYGSADEIVPKIVSGELDVAAVPANLASVLYAKTEGKIKVAAVNTLGVLYVVETGDEVHSIADLAGKTIYTTGKGTTPEYVLNYLLTANGLDPATDVTIEYKSEATEVAAAMQSAGENVIAMLPQPYVTALAMKLDNLRVALDMTEEWNRVSPQSGLVTGVLIARTAFIEENPLAFDEFLADYKASTEYVNNNVPAAAALIAQYGIVEKAPIAEKAIPACNITYRAGAEMKASVSGYLKVLFDQNPKAVGGALPDDGFYYHAA